MRKQLTNNYGYTLFLTVLIMVLFSIMAVAVLTLISSGMAKNDIREDNVQATELAQKSLSHIVNDINVELQHAISEDGTTQETFTNELINTLDSLICGRNAIEKENVTGNYKICIQEYTDSIDEKGNLVKTKKDVTFLSLSTIEGRKFTNKFTVKLGAEPIPDALNYAIGSHQNECPNDKAECEKIPGEGNLFLHGGVDIKGDLKVDGDLITSSYGIIRTGWEYQDYKDWNDHWIESINPAIFPSNEEESANLVVGGNVYSVKYNPNYYNHINSNEFSTHYYKKTNNLDESFTRAPVIKTRETIKENIDIEKHKEQYPNVGSGQRITAEFASISGILETWFGNGRTATLRGLGNSDYYGPDYIETCFWGCSWKNIDYYIFEDTNSFGEFSTNKSVKIEEGKTTINNGMYVGGDLIIGNNTDSYEQSYYDDVFLDGTIFVDGDLTIKGADAVLNALIYVNGNVTIENTVINANDEDSEKSLIVFADGEIKIANNSVNKDTPSNIRGYFYSNDKFEMYGVGSNIRIEGGISARRIVLNAVRGSVRDLRWFFGSYCPSGYNRIDDYCFKNNTNFNKPSRLEVIYDPEIIEKYSDLRLEPIIYNLSPPELIERE